MTLLAPEPSERYATAGQLEQALSTFLAERLEGTAPSPWRMITDFLRQIRRPLLTGTLMVACISSGLWFHDRWLYREASEHFEKAATLHSEADLQGAIGQMRAGLEVYPGSPEAWYKLAMWQRGIGRWTLSLESSRRASELRGRAPESLRFKIDYLHARNSGRVVEEREWEDGELAEVSRNFVVACRETGNIWRISCGHGGNLAGPMA